MVGPLGHLRATPVVLLWARRQVVLKLVGARRHLQASAALLLGAGVFGGAGLGSGWLGSRF